MPREIGSDLIEQVVGSVFTTMLDLEVSTAEEAIPLTGDRLTSSVYLEGEWNGAVMLECDSNQACQFTGKLLGMDPPDEFNDDVRDVLGELANMIGGNIKSVISPEDRLSLPSVIRGSQYEVSVCGSEVRQRVGFRFSGGIFWITVLGKALSN
jgi:chemotaxis protein CheX